MKNSYRFTRFVVALMLAVTFALPHSADAYDDSVALHGIHHGKAFFDFNLTMVPEEMFPLLLRGVIETHGSLVAQGVTPDFIVSFRGFNMHWLAKTTSGDIAQMITTLDYLGVRIEACNWVMDKLGMDPETLLPEIEVVGNSWISGIAYESKNKEYSRITF